MRALALLALTSCSMSIVGPPSPLPDLDEPLTCTDKSSGPALDILAGLGLGVLIGGTIVTVGSAEFGNDANPHDHTGATVGGLLVGGLIAVPFFWSATSGVHRMNACRKARKERAIECEKAGAACIDTTR